MFSPSHRDGATCCGVFCAVYNAIEQLQQDDEVDMFSIVQQLQCRRPEMISSKVKHLYILIPQLISQTYRAYISHIWYITLIYHTQISYINRTHISWLYNTHISQTHLLDFIYIFQSYISPSYHTYISHSYLTRL